MFCHPRTLPEGLEFSVRVRVRSAMVVFGSKCSKFKCPDSGDPEDLGGRDKWVWGCAPAGVQGAQPPEAAVLMHSV